uniref:Endoplasmic reticulum membrane sensor NFE2L1 n=1 Tax=Oryzias latipes TaxID=8090 RepID=A0A3P9HSI7_ORYLA
MLHLKKLFTEGLVQMAVLLSLSGLGVDVDLESYLPPIWLDATFAPMKPHDRRGGLYPKSVDLQELLTYPRLHKQVHSLHRLQVPDAVLETWLVQQEPLERPAQVQREWSGLPVEPRAADPEEEEDEEGGSVASGVPSSNPLLLRTPVIPPDLPPTAEDLELLWQDVSFLLEDEGTDLERVALNGSPHGDLLGSRVQPEAVLLPLTPSTELDDHTSAPTTNFSLDPLPLSLNSSDLPTQDPFKDFLESLNNISTTLNFGLLPEHPLLEDEPEAFGADPTPPSFTQASDGKMSQECLESSSSDILLGQEEEEDLPSLLTELLGDDTLLDDINLLDLDLEEGFGSKPAAKLEKGFYRDVTQREEEEEDHMGIQEDAEEVESDSGLSLDCSHSPASSGAFSGSSSYSSSSSSTPMSCTSSDRTVFSEDEDRSEGSLDSERGVTIKQEEGGAVGGSPGYGKHLPVISEDHKEFHGFPSWLEDVGHDHTYNQMHPRKTSSALRSGSARRHGRSSSHRFSEARLWSRSELERVHSLKIPFSTELMVNLPVDQFNEMLSDCQLSEEQLTLVKNIRRRGKNKIAAQNCRRRKHDILLGLEEDVSALRRRHSTLLRENRDALRRLQQMKHRLGVLYQEVLSELRDEEGGLNAAEFTLLFGPDGKLAEEKSSQKQRRKKK